jgi:hypothetical protein
MSLQVAPETLTYLTQGIAICCLLELLLSTNIKLSGYTESAIKLGIEVTFPCLRGQAHFQRVGI